MQLPEVKSEDDAKKQTTSRSHNFTPPSLMFAVSAHAETVARGLMYFVS